MLTGEEKKAYQKDYMRKKRAVRPDVVRPQNVRPVDVDPVRPTKPSTVPTYFKDGVEMVAAEGLLPERPRYHTCTDGQIMDRANPPKADLSRLSVMRLNQLAGWANAPPFVPSNPKANRTVLQTLVRPKG